MSNNYNGNRLIPVVSLRTERQVLSWTGDVGSSCCTRCLMSAIVSVGRGADLGSAHQKSGRQLAATLSQQLFRRKAVVEMEAESGSETGRATQSIDPALPTDHVRGRGTIVTGIFFVLSEAVPIAAPAVVFSSRSLPL